MMDLEIQDQIRSKIYIYLIFYFRDARLAND